MSLLEAVDLVKYYRVGSGLLAKREEVVRAVDGISLSLHPGETLGLVGESGCGKSTLTRLILRLEEPTAGKVFFSGQDITALRGNILREIRRKLQVVFQNSGSTMNPLQTVGAFIGEPLKNFKTCSGKEYKTRVQELLLTVGLNPEHYARYPHEFSGGQRQRIGIARALALSPQLVICDEPVSSLDVSIQAQILNLLKRLKKEFNLAYLFISHDLAVVSHISDRIAVMYLGKIVEILPCKDLIKGAGHPYTRALLSAVPVADPRQRKNRQAAVKGEPPDPVNPSAGCRFHPRCSRAIDRCRVEEPVLQPAGKAHCIACHLLD